MAVYEEVFPEDEPEPLFHLGGLVLPMSFGYNGNPNQGRDLYEALQRAKYWARSLSEGDDREP